MVLDDTLFHRYGAKTHAVFWQHDGSAKGRDGIGRGNCFVVVGLAVTVPLLARAVCLPVLFGLHVPKSGISKPDAARTLVGLLARALPERTIHVVADAAYRGPARRTLPGNTTFTTRPAPSAVLHALPPGPTGRRGHPAWKGPRLGTCTDLAATPPGAHDHGDPLRQDRHRAHRHPHLPVVGLAARTPVTVVPVKDTDPTRPYDIAPVSTDTGIAAETITARYADRWSVDDQGLQDPDRHRRRRQPAPPCGRTQRALRDAGPDHPRPVVRRAWHRRNGPSRRPRPSTLEPQEDPHQHRRTSTAA